MAGLLNTMKTLPTLFGFAFVTLLMALHPLKVNAQGAIASGENRDGITTANHSDTWTFTANTNDNVTLTMAKLTGIADFYPQFKVYAPDGTLLDSRNDSSSAYSNLRVTQSGTFTVIANSYYNDGTGTYRLRFAKVPGAFVIPVGDEGGPLTNGASHDGTIDLGDLDIWTFTANTNDNVTLTMAKLTGIADFYPQFKVYAPDGTLLDSRNDNLSAYSAIRVTQSGIFTVIANSYYNDGTGTYRLRLAKVPGSYIVPASDEGGALNNSTTYDSAIDLGDLDIWTFTAITNDKVVLTMTKLTGNADFYPQLKLYGPNGTLIDTRNSSSSAYSSNRVTQSGTFTVIANSYFNDGTGTYRLSVLGTSSQSFQTYGQVTETGGGTVTGAVVTAFVNSTPVAATTTDSSGNYQLASLSPGAYTLNVTHPTHGSATRSFTLAAGTARQDFQLTIKPPPPTVVQTNRVPTSHEVGSQFSGNLKVFTNGIFVSGIALNSTKKTIVLTHGWNSSSDDWPSNMASQFGTAGISANLVAWDWRVDAKQDLPQTALLKTPAQGNALGTNLLQALGAGYHQPIHFVGHSFGTLVNAGAANYLHTNGFAWTNTQMTLFDEAEIASDLRIVSPSTWNLGWIKPLPNNYAWADNYMSAVGELQLSANVVNVILTENAPGTFFSSYAAFYNAVVVYHGVPCGWYGNTILNPASSVMGNIWSFERNSSFTTPVPGTFFEERDGGLVEISWLLASQYRDQEISTLGDRYVVYWALKEIHSGVNVVNDVTATVIETGLTDSGPAYQTTPATIGISSYAPPTPSFWSPQLILQNHPLNLQAPLIAFKANSPTPNGSSSAPSNSPAYAWLPLTIPTDATAMSFDFMLQGDGAGDSFEAALNDTNVFSLATSLIQTNVTMNSGLIDVSSYAGQNVELFLGIVGGNSTNTVLAVSGIRLYSMAAPLLQAQTAGNSCVLSWPLSAADYTLETSTNLISWTAVSNVPAIVNLQNASTNPAYGGTRFYRLKK